MCLFGPPGTGKTAYGKWLANQLEMPLIVKKVSDIASMFVGGTEKNIAEAFEQAKSQNAILLMDEVDSFLQDRRSAQRSWEITEVNEMLTQMESFNGIFIASTNLMDNLDQASLRRFDLKVKFDFLKADQSWLLFQRYCEQMQLPIQGDILQRKMQCLPNITPGDFAAIARQNRFNSIDTAFDLLKALEAECGLKENAVKQSIGFVTH
jgi:SpoVK/Ycf46/Vps4 family AAA+-type ATPase